MIELFLIMAGAAANATENKLLFHFEKSIFKNKSRHFWDPSISWKAARRIFGYKLDAWHLFKSAWIFLLLAAVVVAEPWQSDNLIRYIIYGAAWIIVFNAFFNNFLKSDP